MVKQRYRNRMFWSVFIWTIILLLAEFVRPGFVSRSFPPHMLLVLIVALAWWSNKCDSITQ